jgi:hypothetical protein
MSWTRSRTAPRALLSLYYVDEIDPDLLVLCRQDDAFLPGDLIGEPVQVTVGSQLVGHTHVFRAS